MKPVKTKAQLRQEMEQQISDFMAHGGEIEAIPPGTSGRDPQQALPPAPFNEQKQARTPLTEEIKALEARKHKKNPPQDKKSKTKKVLITDDFGEPLRWVWQD